MMNEQTMMEREAILHIPLSNYAFANSEHNLTIRLRAKRGDLTACTLFYGDRCYNHTPVKFFPLQMQVNAQDDLFDYYEVTFESPYTRVCYYFKLEKGEEWTYYYADHFTTSLADFWLDGTLIEGRSDYYQYPFILREEIPDVPDWFKHATVYNIFPDSFASGYRKITNESKEIPIDAENVSRNRCGGTIEGIRMNLDHIQRLGFDCIYLNPIFVAGEYHKYDIIDYFHIDPCLGTDEDFLQLVEELHNRGMRIIIDGVFNHCSWRFFAFEDVVQKGEDSIYKDWFYELTFPVVRPLTQEETPGYACFAYERKMPKLNTSNEEVQNYFAEVGTYWIEKFHVDGWRLDVANEIDRNFWRHFRKAVKEAKPDAVMVGEVWEDSSTWLRGDAFDSTMNYEFRRICREFIASSEIDAIAAARRFEKMRLRYPANLVDGQMNLLDSHDVVRFLSVCEGDKERWKLAFLLLILFPGVPSVFYGDELDIEGITENGYRSPMAWRRETETTTFVAHMIRIRKQFLTGHCDYHPMWEFIQKSLFAFERKNDTYHMKVCVNAGNQSEELPKVFVDSNIICSYRMSGDTLGPWGYCIAVHTI